jgi:hypothetical protein
MSLVLELGDDVRTLDFGIYSETEAANFPAVPPSGNAPLGEAPAGESVTTEQTIKVSVGDYVWWDTNEDGRQDETDIPLEGVVLRIYTVDGEPVFDVFGNPVVFTTTNAQGWYTFDNLPPGQYRVEIEAPEGFVPTLANVGSVDGDSSTGFAVSRILVEDEERDPTLDFGFVPASGGQLPAAGLSGTTYLQISLSCFCCSVCSSWLRASPTAASVGRSSGCLGLSEDETDGPGESRDQVHLVRYLQYLAKHSTPQR